MIMDTILMIIIQGFILVIFAGFLYTILRKFFAVMVDIEVEQRLEELDKDNLIHRLEEANNALEKQIDRFNKLTKGEEN